jgi:hypothetical protein
VPRSMPITVPSFSCLSSSLPAAGAAASRAHSATAASRRAGKGHSSRSEQEGTQVRSVSHWTALCGLRVAGRGTLAAEAAGAFRAAAPGGGSSGGRP